MEIEIENVNEIEIDINNQENVEIEAETQMYKNDTFHNNLKNLDYEHSGHTGFQPAGNYVTEEELDSKGYLTELPEGTVIDSNYTHTDNNFTSEYKNDVEENTYARHTHNNKSVIDTITSENIETWNNKSDFSGDYNDLTNKPDLSEFITKDVDDLTNYTTTGDMNTAISNAVSIETINRQNADNVLQGQIDAITVSSDVVDIVSTYQDLLDYDTSSLTQDDVIKVLQDSTHNDALSYYRWVSNSWEYLGSEGPFYTKSETDSLLNNKQNKIDSTHKLSSDLVDDTGHTNKFVTSTEKETWNNKIDQSALANYIKDTDYATQNTGGVIRANSAFGLNMSNGNLFPINDSYANYQTRGNNYFISKGTLENVITGKELVNQTTLDNSQSIQDEHIDRVETLSNLFDDKTGTGTDITINDTEDTMLKLNLKGNTYQYSTTGKNLLVSSLSTIKSRNTNGTWNNNVYTYNGVTFTVNDDLSVTIGGSYSSRSYMYVCQQNFDVSPASYTLSGCPSGGSASTYLIGGDLREGSTYIGSYNDTGSGETKDLSSYTSPKLDFYIDIRTSDAIGKTFKPMLRLSSITDDTYEPYTNGASPNPDYPQDIEVVTGDNEITVCGKNLFDVGSVSDYTIGGQQAYFTIENNTLKNRIELGASNFVIKNKKYYINNFYFGVDSDKETKRPLVRPFDEYDNPITSSITGWDYNSYYQGYYATSNKVFNCPTARYVQVGFAWQGTTGETLTYSNIMITTSQDTTYEPYKSQVYPINLGNIEMCKIGDYKDSFRQSTGKNLLSVPLEQNGTTRLISIIPNFKPGTYTISFKANLTATWQLSARKIINGVKTELNHVYNAYSCSFVLDEIADLEIEIYRNTITLNEVSKVMLNEGSIATEYEPYGKVTWYKHAEIGKVVLDGSENWTSYGYAFQTTDYKSSINNALSNYFTYSTGWNSASEDYRGKFNINATTLRFMLTDVTITTAEQFKSWLSTHNTEVYYILATPTNTEITDTNLINQLNTIKYALAYNEQTNIIQTNDEQPFIIDYETYKKVATKVSELTNDAGYTTNVGTITGITMNGTSKGTSGVVDLGTVITEHQDISGKLDTSKVKTTTDTTAGNVYDVTYINTMLGNIESLLSEV